VPRRCSAARLLSPFQFAAGSDRLALSPPSAVPGDRGGETRPPGQSGSVPVTLPARDDARHRRRSTFGRLPRQGDDEAQTVLQLNGLLVDARDARSLDSRRSASTSTSRLPSTGLATTQPRPSRFSISRRRSLQSAGTFACRDVSAIVPAWMRAIAQLPGPALGRGVVKASRPPVARYEVTREPRGHARSERSGEPCTTPRSSGRMARVMAARETAG
jgi:hypothetical protein